MPFDEHPFSTEEAERALNRSRVGGGATYTPQWTREDADVIVSEPSEWDRADRHDVVYIADGVTIDVTGQAYFDLSGTAVIGGRHKPGVQAGMIRVRDNGPDSAAYRGVLRALNGSGNVEGIRLRGPSWYPERASEYQETAPTDVRCWPGYEHIAKTGTRASRDKKREDTFSRGINLHHSNSTVRNCDIHGFTHCGVSVGAAARRPTNVTIAYNKIHNCATPGLGYPLNVFRGTVTSEYNFYNAYRHSVTGFGHHDMGYTTRNDVHGPDAMLAPVDMHAISENGGASGDLTAGRFLNVEQCTFLAGKRYETPGWYTSTDNPAISIRGRPASGGGYTTHDCQFVHGSESAALSQRNVSFPTGWTRGRNEYGGPENWSADAGAPVDWTGAGDVPEERNQQEARRARGRAVVDRLGDLKGVMQSG